MVPGPSQSLLPRRLGFRLTELNEATSDVLVTSRALARSTERVFSVSQNRFYFHQVMRHVLQTNFYLTITLLYCSLARNSDKVSS